MEEHMTEFDSEFCRVAYQPKAGAVLLTWKRFACGADYRTPASFAWELFKKYPASRFIVDARDGFEDDPEDVNWGVTVLLPGLAETSCKKVGFILKEVNEIEEEMDMWTLEFGRYFTVVKGESYEEVLKKLKD